jgi:hypothetical protein
MPDLLRKNPGVEAAPLQDELLVVDPETHKFYVLNRTAAFIWETLDDTATVAAAAEKLTEQYEGVSIAEATEDVQSTLHEMQALHLITVGQ